MSIRSKLNGTFDRARLNRLHVNWLIAWSATVNASERSAQESELIDFVEEAREALEASAASAVEVKDGEIIGVICDSATE